MSQAYNLSSNLLAHYLKQGFVVVPKVISSYLSGLAVREAEVLKKKSGFFSKGINKDNGGAYVDRVNRVSHFFDNAYDANGELDKQSMVKIGHALHINKIFQEITYCHAVQQIQSELQMENLMVIQSMMLEKLPMKGGKVVMHQDSTYMMTEPETITGYWLPLQDVDQKNGCIWALPGSHTSKLYQKMIMENGAIRMEMDGPIDYKESECVPIPMKQGDLLIFSGRLLHKSNDNTSISPRYTYTWHTMNKSSKWSPYNWMSMEQIQQNQVRPILL